MQDLLTRLLLAGGGGFSPSALFGGGAVQGAWYDPSDFGTTGTGGVGTLFQDSAGTTPVTAVEQPVGLMLDKSKGLTLGSELLADPGFDNAGSWETSAGVTITGGEAVWNTAGTSVYVRQPNIITADTYYEFTVVCSSYTSGTVLVAIGVGGTTLTSYPINAVGTVRFRLNVGANSSRVWLLTPSGGAQLSITSFSVKQVLGNHAYQSTSASRPTLRARYNLLTYSEEFNDAAWTKQATTVNANATTAPDGTATADKIVEDSTNAAHSVFQGYTSFTTQTSFSFYAKAAERNWVRTRGDASFNYFNLATGTIGTLAAGRTATMTAVGNGWYRIVVTWTSGMAGITNVQIGPTTGDGVDVYTGDGTSGIFAWGAQLVFTAVFPSNTYQRIADAATYATGTAFPPYLFFDGIDDSMLTNSVDFATVTSDGQARRNLLSNPTQFDVTTSWSVNTLSVTANNTTAPDGTSTAELITLGAGTAKKFILQAVSSFSGARTYSFYAKYGTNRFVQILNNGTVEGFANFDIQNGVVGTTGSGVTSSIFDAGNGWWRCVVTHAIAAASDFRIYGVDSNSAGWDSTTTSTGTYFLWGAQLETGSTATAFQNIGTDQMTVFAGVTKSSDAAFGAITELTANGYTTAGGFYSIAAGGAGVPGAFYGTALSGSTSYAADFQTFTAPITNVITQQMDIAQPTGATELTLRVNGVSATRGTTTGTTAGTGNFANAPLFIGRRNNASLPFNGNLYSLIVQGATPTSSQLVSTEQWVAAKTPLGSV